MIISKELLFWVLAIILIIIVASVFITGGLGDLSDKVIGLFGQVTPPQ